jgi:ankyrin repeat protein
LRGADPNRCSPRARFPFATGESPLARALKSVSSEDLSRVELLLANGAKLESQLLFRVIARRVREMEFKTKFLLANGLDPNTTHEVLGTPLHRAIDLGLTNIIKVLLDAGADRTARPAGTPHHDESPLQLAERSQHPAKQAMLDILRS